MGFVQFVHEATSANMGADGKVTLLNHPRLNGNAKARLWVTINEYQTCFTLRPAPTLVVSFNLDAFHGEPSNKWGIDQGCTDVRIGTRYNVLAWVADESPEASPKLRVGAGTRTERVAS
ncbi:MAG: hypothetical protein HY329_22820 [Chloroflexi bacterium]|nr:hypothetical protein [Chloroflexota bacterium]